MSELSQAGSVVSKVGDGDMGLADVLTGDQENYLNKLPVIAQSARQTVIRLKRRIEDSPSKILVVSYKKLRTDCAGTSSDVPSNALSDPVCSNVLRLVGTVLEEENDKNIALTIRKFVGNGSEGSVCEGAHGVEGRCNFRKSIKAKSKNLTEKTRESFKKTTEDNRFKLITSRRGMTEDVENSAGSDNDLLQLLDLVPESDVKESRIRAKPEGYEPGNITCNGKPMIKDVSEDEKGYVYDLYLSNHRIEDFICSQFVSVEEGDDDMVFGDYREEEEERLIDDDDDSNAEDNWRNDYPDSEEEGLRDDQDDYSATGKYSDDEMHNNFRGMHIKGDSSSDDDVIFGIEDDNNSFGFDSRYASYKRRIAQEYEDEVVSISTESDDD